MAVNVDDHSVSLKTGFVVPAEAGTQIL